MRFLTTASTWTLQSATKSLRKVALSRVFAVYVSMEWAYDRDHLLQRGTG